VTLAELINEWIDAYPGRNQARLARITGVPKSTISAIVSGRSPSLEVAIRLGSALSTEQVFAAICSIEPQFGLFVGSLKQNITMH
jgi:plasmid maintenance system antidote protein VapI